jgi:spermidine synthase
MKVTMNPRRVATLLFFSGLCALIYQTVWMRDLRLIFGASTLATGAVLAIFMGGLGVGSALLGRRADRHATPLAFYGQLEMLIAVSAAVTPLLLMAVRAIYLGAGGSASLGPVVATLIRLVLSALVLFIPTALMGGTLPAAARAVETADDAGRRHLALLYGVNTLGAVVGALLSTFFLLERLGNRGTLLTAAVVNVIVGALAWQIGRDARKVEVAKEEPFREAALRPSIVLPAAALVGFSFLLMELVWYRMLSPLLGGTTFMFGLVLAVALAGIGIGGAIYSFGRGDRTASASAFTATCTLEALAIMLPFAMGDRLAILANSLRSLSTFGFAGFVGSWIVMTAIVVFPAALIAGYQFPLLISLLGRGRENVGHEVGLTYAWNTGGAIAASLLGSFILIPTLGAIGSWKAAAWLLVGLGFVTFLFSLREKKWLLNAVAIAATIGVIASNAALGPTAVWRHSGIGAGRAPQPQDENAMQEWLNTRRSRQVFEADGRESTIAIDATDDPALIVNGKSDGSARSDAGTQVMSGIIGALLHPNPRSAMIVGLGTGETAGWLGAVPSIERVDAVELEPVVIDVARTYFADVNHGVLENPKVHVSTGDAREFLLTTDRKYDIIFSEPSNPYRAGIASLYTREFYAAAADRLEPGGVFLQWVQTYSADALTLKTIYATILTSFPYVQTWTTASGDLVLLASREQVGVDVARLRQRLTQEPYRTAAHVAWRVEDAEGFLSHFIAGELVAERAAMGMDLNTDDRQVIEFSFARALHFDRFHMQNIADAARRLNAQRPKVSGAVDWARVDSNRSTIEWLNMNDARNQFARHYVTDDFGSALAVWRATPFAPVNSGEASRLAHVLASAGDETALQYLDQLRELRPAEADAIVAILRTRQGRFAEAIPMLRGAFERYREDPWPVMRVMRGAADAATQVAATDRRAAVVLTELFTRPFAALQIEDSRIKAHLALSWAGGQCSTGTLAALQSIEPHVPWKAPILRMRATCYRAAQLGELTTRAEDDFRRFVGNEAGTLIE